MDELIQASTPKHICGMYLETNATKTTTDENEAAKDILNVESRSPRKGGGKAIEKLAKCRGIIENNAINMNAISGHLILSKSNFTDKNP